MPALPPESTGRVWIDYSTGGGATSQNHTVMMRYNADIGGSFAGALTYLGQFITAVGTGGYYDGWVATAARYSLPGEVISIPAPLPIGLVGFVGSGQASAFRMEQARETRFVGRSPLDGRRVSLSLYGKPGANYTQFDFRQPRVPEGWVDNYLDVIDEAPAAYFVAIGGQRAVWRDYANWQFNSYWEGELRV